ncbi:hypothetical protein TRVL_09215 [Trypanosoma vivax]|nr:hypothetical protein TRVL_09215 [Trypanosoma vivax]
MITMSFADAFNDLNAGGVSPGAVACSPKLCAASYTIADCLPWPWTVSPDRLAYSVVCFPRRRNPIPHRPCSSLFPGLLRAFWLPIRPASHLSITSRTVLFHASAVKTSRFAGRRRLLFLGL